MKTDADRAETRRREDATDWFGKLPTGWKIGRVGQYYGVTLGKMLQSFPETESDTLESYYCAANVHFDGVSNEGLKQMWFSASEKDETEVRTGDILVVEGGAGAGNTALVKSVSGPTFMQNSVLRIRPSRDTVCNGYLCYHLQWLLRSGYIPYICNKATIPHFTKEKLAKAPLPLPPFPAQQRIVARLDALCAEIDAQAAVVRDEIAKLEEWRRSVIADAVTGGAQKRANDGADTPSLGIVDWLGKLPNGWKAGRVGQYYEVTLGKMLQSIPQTEADTLESYYCAANVHFDGVSNEELKQMWFSPSEKAETEVRVGDILVVEGGAGAGNTALVKEVSGPTFMQNSVLRIRASRDSVCNAYLCYHLQWLLRSGYIPYICNKATIPHFTKEKLAKAPLPLPPLPEQKRIVARLDALCAEADGILAIRREQLEMLDEWRRATIYEYTTGKKRA